MTIEDRQKWLDYNELLCGLYVETGNEAYLADIAMTEQVLFNDPDHIRECELCD